MREARALDQAMEDRIVARKSSSSSIGSTGLGMGAAWRNRYSGRKRTGSLASVLTTGSVLSEHLMEEDEEPELLGVGSDFDGKSLSGSSAEPTEDESSTASHTASYSNTISPATARPAVRRSPYCGCRLPPLTKASFNLPPVPSTAVKSSFDVPHHRN
ncbi:hypothetical protein A0H81_00731 [Grifola frondosa]|uniref:Uncharacterized protein n=1 Tax=Grifola frondosa TaxID=5627 RepID=A0A1C7MQJ2_GRIFR|nr:hypothetical protein A0H81_00731 [Grifola frondosa]